MYVYFFNLLHKEHNALCVEIEFDVKGDNKC